MAWEGEFDAAKGVYTGVYTFPDESKFIGSVTISNIHRIELKDTSGMFSKISEHPCEPFEVITGTWVSADGKGSAPHKPPLPDESERLMAGMRKEQSKLDPEMQAILDKHPAKKSAKPSS